MSFSMDTQADINGLYKSREDNADLLVRVIVYDLDKNEGNAGKYFSFFTYKMNKLDAGSRKLINDVINKVEEGIKHNANHVVEEDVKEAFEDRLQEISNY
jgi:hypothetical protein